MAARGAMSRSAGSCLAALLLLVFWTAAAAAMPLPAKRLLTIQLSGIGATGQVFRAATTTALTDEQGKFSFSFASIPSAEISPFLLLEVKDGPTVLRRSIALAPETGGAAEVGIGEVADLQAAALLKALDGSGLLRPLHLVAALTMLRSVAIPLADAERTGSALNAAVAAFYASLTAEGATAEQVARFDGELLAGLRRVMARYRQSVDAASTADASIEAKARGEAFALLMGELIDAGTAAGLLPGTVTAAYLAAGGSAEADLTRQNITPAVLSLVRAGFAMGMTQCQARSFVSDITRALGVVGNIPSGMLKYLIFLQQRMVFAQQGGEILLADPQLADARTYETAIFNSLAIRDLIYLKALFDLYGFDYDSSFASDCDALRRLVIGRMAATDGVMSGMTLTRLQAIMGSGELPPIDGLQLPVWAFVTVGTHFSYQAIPELAAGVDNPPVQPQLDLLADPYRSLAALGYDITLMAKLNSQDQIAAENAAGGDTPRWLSLVTVADLARKAQTRRNEIRQRIGGLSEAEREAFLAILSGIGGSPR